jgi:hypothetical protein
VSDLRQYIAKRLKSDPEFADGFETGYAEFKQSVLQELTSEQDGITQAEAAPSNTLDQLGKWSQHIFEPERVLTVTEQQKEHKIQQAIRQAEDDLVIAIQTALDDKSSYSKLEESQFHNLVRVADTTDSVEVIKNFLRYQIGRDNKWGSGKNSLATKIINDIDNQLQEIAKRIAKEAEVSDSEPIRLELIRRYLSYAARYLKYKREEEPD